MNIILENVVIGLTTTGVAKVMDGKVNVTNVPFNVSTRAELDVFIDKLLKNQVEFAGLTNGPFTVTPILVPEAPVTDLVNQSFMAIVQAEAKRKVNAELVSQVEIDVLVATYKALVNAPKIEYVHSLR